MFIITKRLTRGKAVGAVLVLGGLLMALILLVGGCHRGEEETPLSAESAADRLAYLAELGWEVESEPVETLRLQLPDSLAGSDYEAYNELQLSQGFDLAAYCGRQVVRYTYTVLNYPGREAQVQLNLYCCDGAVIAGDVMALGADGFQGPLAFPAGA
ncbi:MAG: DUF4830 domain-containing protein [Oscillospiraceae bacterium]